MEINLKDRLALVTGGSGAIGSSICIYLSRAGARVVAACHPADSAAAQKWAESCNKQGIRLEIAAFDVSDPIAAEVGFSKVKEEFGGIDILVNGAGITRDAPLRKMSVDQWRQVMSVNLDSVFNASRWVVEGMMARGWGRIVNISSVNGQKGQFGQTNYSAAKAGMHGFTMALAQEVARKGVTVNTVSPGYVDSPMIQAVPDGIRTKILDGIPAGRFGNPEEIAATVTFLCSEQAGYINGANLPVNGAQFTCA